VTRLLLPASLRAVADGSGPMAAWVAALPALVADAQDRWQLTIDPPFEPGGQTAWVAPARTTDGREAVLKVLWRHDESEHEAAGLRAWAGDGAVQLLDERSTENTTMMLLERADPGTPLATRPEPDQDLVIGELLPRLWIDPPPGHPFRPLADMCDLWASSRERRAHDAHEDAGLVRTGIDLFRALPRDADRAVLLATDLHAQNVLAATREPWLVIDPKPYVGDPTYDALQHLLNCPARLHRDPLALVRRMAGLLDLDADRLRRWLFARCIVGDLWDPPLADVAKALAP
jgi:streptomycin 6-kinase